MTRFHRNMLWALGVFIVLWGAVVTWELHDLNSIDDYLALTINGLAGRSETLDVLFVFLSRIPGTYMTILLFLISTVLLSSTRTKHRPLNIPLYFVFLAVISLAGGLLVEAMDHYVKRPAPAETLEGFVRPESLLGITFFSDPKTTFPDIRIAIFSILFFQTLFRFGSRALFFLAWLLVVAVADIYCGTSWPSDALGSLMFGWLFSCLVYLSPINKAYQNLDSRSFEWLLKALRRLSLEVRKLRSRSKAGTLPGARVVAPDGGPAGSLPEKEATLLREYYGIEDLSLEASPHKDSLFAIRADGTAYAFKRSGISTDHSQLLNEILEIVHSLQEVRRLKVPRIVPSKNRDLSITDGTSRYYLMEWMSGSPLSLSEPGHVRGLMQALARLHAATRVPDSPEAATQEFDKLARAFPAYSEAASRLDSGWLHAFAPNNAERARHEGAFETAFSECETISKATRFYTLEDRPEFAYCWIHRDVHPLNFLVSREGDVILLDFDHMRPGLAVLDLAQVMHHACRSFLWNFDALNSPLEKYLAISPLSRSELTLLLSCILLPVPVPRTGEFDDAGFLQKVKGERRKLTASRLPMLSQVDKRARDKFVARFCRQYGLELPLVLLGYRSGEAGHSSGAAIALTNNVDLATLDSNERVFASLVQRHIVPSFKPVDRQAESILRHRIVAGHATGKSVRMLQFDGDPRIFVVRAGFRRLNPLRPWGRFRRFQQAADFCRLMETNGISVPQIEYTMKGVEWNRLMQYWIGVEEFMEGGELDRGNRNHVVRAFEQLGRIHALRSDRWGRPGPFSGGTASTFADKALQRARRQLRRSRLPVHAGADRDLAEWAEQRISELFTRLGPRPFSLIHGDYKCTNNLYTPDSRVVTIDFMHTRYWLSGIEFLDALAHFCQNNELACEAARAYFDSCDEEAAAQLREGEAVLLLLASLDWLSRKNPSMKLTSGHTLNLLDSWDLKLMADGPDSPWDEVVRTVCELRIFASPNDGDLLETVQTKKDMAKLE